MGDASTALQSGIGALAGTGAMYDPNSYQDFMNPYEDQVLTTLWRTFVVRVT